MSYKTKYRSFSFGSNIPLSHKTLDSLIAVFRSKQVCSYDCPASMDFNSNTPGYNTTGSILNGRGAVKYIKIPEAGYIAVKEYQRGGLVHYFNKNIYFNICGSIRSQREFGMLIKAKKAGLNVPEPIAYASRGSLFYKAWLVTKKINKCQNFADISLKESKRAAQIFPEISDSIKKLIKNHIYHVDLHPGNILIDINNKNYIIDFDKAIVFKGTKSKLISLYKKRWAKAVLKYHLPDFISVPELI